MNSALSAYYRLPGECASLVPDALAPDPGYFTFHGVTAYGRVSAACSPSPHACPAPALQEKRNAAAVHLPFDVDEVIENLRCERYLSNGHSSAAAGRLLARRAYYALRPHLPVHVRKYLQRLAAAGWKQRAFPRWPVDCSVDDFMQALLSVLLQARGDSPIPFIWFWPHGFSSAAILTHDVETRAGCDFCAELMDVDESFGFKSSFQVVPEVRYLTPPDLVNRIRSRDFEIAIHDLNHDGTLFDDRAAFEKSASRINAHAREFGASGFRSAVLYRNPDWLNALDLQYDMSFPNVAPLDPQPGGCCTVMPFQIGNMIELPLTTVQDYTLFHLLGSYSLAIWKQQVETIVRHNGLISILAHPDYLMNPPAMECYRALLASLRELGSRQPVWWALPHEVAEWWRDRSQMSLMNQGGHWKIVGDPAGRAVVAYAVRCGDRVSFEVPNQDRSDGGRNASAFV